MRIALGIFIIAHGLVHSILAIAPNPADPDAKVGLFFTSVNRSWMLPRLGLNPGVIQAIGIILVALSTLGFLLAGLGILGVGGLSVIWRTVAVVSSIISSLLLIIFWHPWLPVGLVIDILTVVGLLVIKWPPVDLFGS
jgi:hypothetical protein